MGAAACPRIIHFILLFAGLLQLFGVLQGLARFWARNGVGFDPEMVSDKLLVLLSQKMHALTGRGNIVCYSMLQYAML